MEIKYIVRKSFQYDGRQYKPGEEFIPSGQKWDKILLDPQSHFVRAERSSDKPAKRRGRKDNGEKSSVPDEL
jgi:hypothetical protein